MCSERGRRGLLCGVSPFGYPRINSRCRSPRLFAARCVLLRLMAPRHPSCARIRLTETWIPVRHFLSAVRQTSGPSQYTLHCLPISIPFVKELALASGNGQAKSRTHCAKSLFSVKKPQLPTIRRSGLVGVTGIGPVTSSLSGTRSNQLSYTPENWWRQPGSNR